MSKRISILAAVLFLMFNTAWSTNKEVSIESLLHEMVDRNILPQYPQPAYTTRQFSSYDRATLTPIDKSWFGNWDRSMFIRTDSVKGRKEYVMMEAEGGGAIVRFWMTFAGHNAGKGMLRIYLDHNPKPVIEGKALDIISGGHITGFPLSSSSSDLTKYEMRGHNLYMPLPYAKYCKVTYESENIKDDGAKGGGEAVYYNINYRTYKQGTKVISFSDKELKKNEKLLSSIQKQLLNREIRMPESQQVYSLKGSVLAGQSISQKIKGEMQAIRKLTFKLTAPNKEQALRSTVLKIRFDGKTTVQCPVGDFFGTGYQIRPLHTWYAYVEAEGAMTCFWVMPYLGECEVTLENRGTQNITVLTGDITVSSYEWNDNTMYFGSSWKQFTRLETGEFKSNEGGGHPFDINYITLKGKGVYIGDGVTLFNTVDAWWGEGDEKIYIDGEEFPSHIGTGTEDYYGYAWCRPENFSNHPFIAQPDGSGNFHAGYTVNLRHRSLDAIPFNHSLRFDMEMWHWVKATINFAPVTYWYIMPEDAVQLSSDLRGATYPVALKSSDLAVPDLWFKGNTHTHSTLSDGDTPLKSVVKWYKEHGYNFLLITDHNLSVTTDTAGEDNTPYFLVIPGNEISDLRSLHTTAINTTQPLNTVWQYNKQIKLKGDTLSTATADILSYHVLQTVKNGGIPVLNHPNFLSGVQVKDILPVKGLRHLEIYNGHPLVYNQGNAQHLAVEAKWDSLLVNRKLLYGIASDDAHHFKDWGSNKANPGRGWVMVKSKHLDTENIMQAIRSGNFYASTGIILSRYDYSVDRKSCTVEVDTYKTRQELGIASHESLPPLIIQFIGYNGKTVHQVTDTRATYHADKAQQYIRVKVMCTVNGNTYCAWGQPIEFEQGFFAN